MPEVTHLFLSPEAASVFDIVATSLFVVYVVLQIMHHRFMWYVYIPSCIAAAVTFFDSATWAFAALNIYYIAMGVVGILHWRRDAAAAEEHKGAIILNKLTPKVLWISVALTALGVPALYFLLGALNDPNPFLDAITTMLSIIATWWLTRSIIQQWWVWIIADLFAIWMNLKLDKSAFVIQFAICIVSCFIGLWNWSRKGKYVSTE
jgi:nicotinamide mononucleotide transporter